MKNYFHIFTEGLERGVIFKDVNHYVFGMNGVPLIAQSYDLAIIAFCLMSNHVHFIAFGKYESCQSFITNYKKRLSNIANVGNATAFIKEIDSKESLLRAIAYVLRNPVAAGIRVMPNCYKWGSGSLYFNEMLNIEGKKAGEMTKRELRNLIRSHNQDIPPHYVINKDGFIDPVNYIHYKKVEQLYGNPGYFLRFLSRNDDMEYEISEGILNRQHYTDSELTGSIIEICKVRFRCSRPEELSIENKLKLASLTKKQYGAGHKQIARLIGIDPNLLKSLLYKSKRPDVARQ